MCIVKSLALDSRQQPEDRGLNAAPLSHVFSGRGTPSLLALENTRQNFSTMLGGILNSRITNKKPPHVTSMVL